MTKKMLLLLVMTALLLPSCFNDIEEVPLEVPEENLQPPLGISTITGNRQVVLSWSSVDEAVSYRLYRSASLGDVWVMIAETADTFYVDEDVSNGIEYLYAVSSVGSTGLESSRSEESPATPSVYSMLINGGLEYTGSTTVVLNLTAPSTTTVMMLSNEEQPVSPVWETFSPTRTWILPVGDGPKTVYATFQDGTGAFSPIVSATIELDTYAGIEELEITPEPYNYEVGATVHIAMGVEGDETGGQAYVEFENLATDVVLFDDGMGGDPVAGDGRYEADYTFPSFFRGTDLVVAGHFTDRAGNGAVPRELDGRLSFTDPPEGVQLIGAIDSTVNMITIRWEQSTEENFAAYRIYRDTNEGVTDDPALFVQGLDFQSQTTYPDGSLEQGVTYYYRIYVVNDLGEATGSNEISASTFDALPVPVTLSDPSAVGPDRLTLQWTINSDSDFAEYRIYRALSPGVTEASSLVTVITDRETTWFDDTGLDTAANLYYYRVMVYDRGGQSNRSNEVSTETP